MSDEVDLRVALALAQKEAAEARAQVADLERKISEQQDWLMSIEQRSGLLSNNLLTRAFTVWAYYLVATLTISLPIGLVVVVVVLLSQSASR